MSLFTFGLMLSNVKIKREYLSKDLLAVILFKNILHPIIAVLVGFYIFHLDRYWLYSLVIAASAPTAFLVYFIAKQFAIETRAVRLIVSISSVISMLTLIFIIIIFKIYN
jgi:malonate transporter